MRLSINGYHEKGAIEKHVPSKLKVSLNQFKLCAILLNFTSSALYNVARELRFK